MHGAWNRKKDLGVLSLTVFALAGLLAAVTVSANPAGQKGNEAKGRYYFKQTCKTCHGKDGKGGEITPLSKTQAQWQSYFERGKHAKGTEPLSKYLTPEQLHDAATFLNNHAVDSAQPETCGK